MKIGPPQIIWIALSCLGLGLAIAKHGEPREPYDATAVAVSFVISATLLWWGGFFG